MRAQGLCFLGPAVARSDHVLMDLVNVLHPAPLSILSSKSAHISNVTSLASSPQCPQ